MHTIQCGERRSSNRSQWTTNNKSYTKNKPYTNHKHCDQVWEKAEALQSLFFEVDRMVDRNARRVREACRVCGLGPHYFAGSTGYGHGDLGRQAMDQIVAEAFGAEKALVRHQFISGTHSIASALYGVLRPGSRLLIVSGNPYDTLHEVIGISKTGNDIGSLQDWGVDYTIIDLLPCGNFNLSTLSVELSNDTWKHQVVYIQRSCGYEMRPTVSVEQIKKVVDLVKRLKPEIPVMVDNCYGEFTEDKEPTHIGADLIMGSLIKNPGGTIVSTGGYVAGRQDLIHKVNARLSAPGIGLDSGSLSGETLRLMFQGFCLAPQMVGEVLKSGMLISHVLTERGFTVVPPPSWTDLPLSFITAIELGSADYMAAFCKIVQKLSPVGSYVQPIPGVTAGYEDPVIFADGTFIDGSTSELSADGPIRSPYVVYCQGGTHWTQWAEILEHIILEMDHKAFSNDQQTTRCL